MPVRRPFETSRPQPYAQKPPAVPGKIVVYHGAHRVWTYVSADIDARGAPSPDPLEVEVALSIHKDDRVQQNHAKFLQAQQEERAREAVPGSNYALALQRAAAWRAQLAARTGLGRGGQPSGGAQCAANATGFAVTAGAVVPAGEAGAGEAASAGAAGAPSVAASAAAAGVAATGGRGPAGAPRC